MSEERTCKQCQAQFTVEDEDLAFYKKISPTFAGRTFEVPAPTLCPECRKIRRLLWRNERVLYKRRCDRTEKEVVTIYNPESNVKVYDNKYWRSDAWDPMQFGQDYDPDRPFLDQLKDLYYKVPKQANNSTIAENCDFCNFIWHSKNCYLCFNVGYSEDCYFSTEIMNCRDCVDCFSIKECESCYTCFDSTNCAQSMFLEKCDDCCDSLFAYDCKGCRNVFMSSNLRNKQYVFKNNQLSKEDYFEKISKVELGDRATIDALKGEFEKLKSKAIHSQNNNKLSENSSGDYLRECSNCRECFNMYKSRDCKYVTNANSDVRDSWDVDNCAELELGYEGASITGYLTLFGVFSIYSKSNFYSIFCENCNSIFGCVGLNRKEYCILNKQYTKDEYEKRVAEIVDNMIKEGEWGEFFPTGFGPFGYNESYANILFPKSKDEALATGAGWQDKDYGPKFKGEFYSPKQNINSYRDSERESTDLLSGVIKCKNSGRPFKIIPQELAFCLNNNIPIPNVSPEERYLELFSHRNPRVLHHRQCMCEEQGHDHEGRCKNEFETTYAPDRPEKVYCENCYQRTVL